MLAVIAKINVFLFRCSWFHRGRDRGRGGHSDSFSGELPRRNRQLLGVLQGRRLGGLYSCGVIFCELAYLVLLPVFYGPGTLGIDAPAVLIRVTAFR